MERVKLVVQPQVAARAKVNLSFKRVLPESVPGLPGGLRIVAVIPTKNGFCRVLHHSRMFGPDNYLGMLARIREAGRLDPSCWQEVPGLHYLSNYGG